MHIQVISLEEVWVPSFLARMVLRDLELDSRKMDYKAEGGDCGRGSRSCHSSGAQFLWVDDHPLPWDSATGLSRRETPHLRLCLTQNRWSVSVNCLWPDWSCTMGSVCYRSPNPVPSVYVLAWAASEVPSGVSLYMHMGACVCAHLCVCIQNLTFFKFHFRLLTTFSSVVPKLGCIIESLGQV